MKNRYWRIQDTLLLFEQNWPPRLLFASNDVEEQFVDCIQGKCRVKYVKEIDNLEEYLKDADSYYYSKIYNYKTFSIEDVEEPTELLEQVVALDLFAGCGGFSSGLQEAGIKVRWAVEYDSTFAESFARNHDGCNIFNMDARKFLKIVKWLHDIPDWNSSSILDSFKKIHPEPQLIIDSKSSGSNLEYLVKYQNWGEFGIFLLVYFNR